VRSTSRDDLVALAVEEVGTNMATKKTAKKTTKKAAAATT